MYVYILIYTYMHIYIHIYMHTYMQVTVSTVAPSVAHIERMAALPSALAWSLHAADDDVRRRLVPTQKCHVHELRDAFVKVLAQRGPGFLSLSLSISRSLAFFLCPCLSLSLSYAMTFRAYPKEQCA